MKSIKFIMKAILNVFLSIIGILILGCLFTYLMDRVINDITTEIAAKVAKIERETK